MRCYFFIPIAFLTILNLDAQVFAPDDAVWHYNFDPDITLDDGYQKIEVVGDTVINEHNCRILRRTNIGYNWFDKRYYEFRDENIYIYEEDSIVYYLNSGRFYKLYDFTANAGDYYESSSYLEHCISFYVTVDSVGYIMHNQDRLKKYYFHINNDSEAYYYLERIGYPYYLLPTKISNSCEVPTGFHFQGPLRCYQDSTIGLYTTAVSSSCSYITNSDETFMTENISLHPNPSHGDLVLALNDDRFYTYEIRDFCGRLIDVEAFQIQININLAEYPTGLYFITIKSNQKVVGIRKILKY